MSIKFEVSQLIPVPLEKLFNAWLDSEQHSKMIGAEAIVSNKEEGSFEVWDGYITGKNILVDPPNRILQSWRTSEFLDSEVDSLLEILFTSEGFNTKITIHHSKLPEHGMQYKQGWIDNYFMPMIAYFKMIKR